MRILSFRHCVLVYLALASLLLSLSLQTLGGVGMDVQLPAGQSSMMEMSDDCEGCNETTASDANCVSFNWSCAQMPTVAIASNGLTAMRPAAEPLALIPLLPPSVSSAPEPQPPRNPLHI